MMEEKLLYNSDGGLLAYTTNRKLVVYLQNTNPSIMTLLLV